MKICYLEPDLEYANRVITALNSTRTKFDILHIVSEELFSLHLDKIPNFQVIILNLKNDTDLKIKRLIRENGGNTTPVILLIEKDKITFELYKTLHYLDNNHELVVKDDLVLPLVHRIFKSCNIWNDDIFFLTKEIYFDFKLSLFVYNDEEIHLGPKESLLLKLLLVKSPHHATCEEIMHFVYEDDFVKNEKIRALVKILRQKIPMNLIQTKKYFGYKISKKFFIN